MGAVLEEIRSGRFAEEWSGQQEQANQIFERVREARDQLPFTRWEDRARAAFRIGDAAGEDEPG
jgi:ketol-acid reductoisomerase